jgi:bifunctional UDP-N-acetylglucosamine pyrophosphorylase / glucosamine-1-phosphate N-acetyltransferase
MTAAALILAAGEGTRMKSRLPKVAHEVLGVPMISLVVDAARDAGVDRVVVVVGYEADVVRELVPDDTCAVQDRQLGTGHAVTCAEEELTGHEGTLLVLSGDTPLIRPETLRRLIEERERTGAAAVVLTTRMSDPTGYGRIIRDADGVLTGIVEHKDLSPDQVEIDEINTGTYCFDTRVLFGHLHRLSADNAQGEYYLTDMVAVLRAEGLIVTSVRTDDPLETMGVNSRVQLAEATRALKDRVNRGHMLAGVTLVDPELVWIGPRVRIGQDVVIEPMTFLTGDTIVEAGAHLGPSTRVMDSFIGAGARIDSSVLLGVEVGDDAKVGPMGYLRPGTVLRSRSKTGAFVEVKNSTVGPGSKVPHLSYIGDATIGSDANVGAGTITCNYDGLAKHPTVVGDGAFVGSDTMLVAPVSIGAGAVTGAGSVISHDVPDGALAIERTEQRIIDGWAARRKKRTEGSERDT